jgi:hypothetical protein
MISISKIRKSRSFKGLAVYIVLSIVAEITVPMRAMALTGGPSQPEFGSFTPIGTSDLVDLSSGDLNYNIPLMDVGGYPINIAYNSGVGMDDEASWVGLGWNLSVGQINRNVRGIPDDFKGDEITYENYIKPTVNVGASLKITTEVAGVEMPINQSLGIDISYNNYSGFAAKPSVGINAELTKNLSVGFNAQSGPDGLSVSPNVSIHSNKTNKGKMNNKLGVNFGVSMNSRQGLVSSSIGASRKRTDVQNKKKRQDQGSVGSSVSYTDELYTPSKRVGMITGSFTLNAALGSELACIEGNGHVSAYGTISKIKESEKVKSAKAYGYAYHEVANAYGILDFNREKDGNFSVNSTNLPLTNFTYDIYSIQGQGVSGTYRPFRNQVGYVFDPYVQDGSTSGNFGAEFGTGNTFHAGLDIEVTQAYSHSGVWTMQNDILQYLKENYNYNPKYEKIHYKNVGDLSVDKDFGMFSQNGSYDPIRIPYVGGKFYRRIHSKIERWIQPSMYQTTTISAPIKRTKRQMRNQAINNVTVGELKKGIGYGPWGRNNSLIPSFAKNHHIGEVQIIRNDGARYVYGIPAYNKTKVEASFAIQNNGNCAEGIAPFTSGDFATIDNSSNWKNLPNDKFLERTTTPAYVHTHLLTSVLSTEYQDLTGDGPTTDDLGSYTSFSYTKISTDYKWRTPYEGVFFNEGLKTDLKDQQGSYVYGEKEMYYINEIKTKTHVAKFHISPRADGKGVNSQIGGLNNNMNSYKLDSISLFSLPEYTANPTSAPKIKVVHFKYNYSLCPGVLNNNGSVAGQTGKLTLEKVYFTYRKSSMGKYSAYTFTYSDINPAYHIKGYDSWGNYKPSGQSCNNASSVTAAEFPYTDQTSSQNDFAQAWHLTQVKLPSGGTLDFTYESDDYSYVQNKKAMRMFKVVGAGNVDFPDDSPDSGAISSPELDTEALTDDLFKGPIGNKHAKYLYIEVPESSSSSNCAAIAKKYFSQLEKNLIHFRFLINMTPLGANATTIGAINNAKYDYVTGYVELDKLASCRVFERDDKFYLSVPIKRVEKEGGILSSNQLVNPIAKSAWHFGRKYLNKHVYGIHPNGDTEDIPAMVDELFTPNIFNNLLEMVTGPNAALENKGIGRRFIKDKSWIRLGEPTGFKKGGGSRVKSVINTDKWATMAGSSYDNMSYGQQYNYSNDNGTSSGVASYEPIGNKENPFVQPVFSSTRHLLAPDDENYIEKPFGESFFPNPQVTYSKVTVSSLNLGEEPLTLTNPVVKKLNKTGKVVHEFYTTKDYPTLVSQTPLQANEDKNQLLGGLLKINVRKHFTASQGYVIHLNDMNGKQKAQWVYAEDQDEPISGVEYRYDGYSNDPSFNASIDPDGMKGKLNNLVKVINPNGTIESKVIGVETDVVHDFRENATEVGTMGINGNLAAFFVGLPLAVPVLLPDIASSKDQFRSVSTTKVINTFGLLKETIAHDAGAKVYTRNLAWDAETGEVLVTETIDEFNDKYYTLNYPAHWFYKGMSQAAKNLGLYGSLTANSNAFTMNNIGVDQVSHYLFPGDELMLTYGSSSSTYKKAWVDKVSGVNVWLIDEDGVPITGINPSFVVTRSGHRNLQSAGIMNVTLMRNPLKNSSGGEATQLGMNFLASNNWVDWKIINAGAVDYSDNWKVACECAINTSEGVYNPFRLNERGVWRVKSSRTYLTGRNVNGVTPRREGYFNSFDPMYKLTASGSWYKNLNNWTFVSEVSRYSPYGFEMENKDALNRYSAALYGYNHSFPIAVGANTKYTELGFDGFEDYGFDGCGENGHFNFKGLGGTLESGKAHTGKYSMRVGAQSQITLTKTTACNEE